MKDTNGLYIVLAAGFSRRFGSSKLLHILPSGDTVISQTIKTIQTAACDFIVVVRDDDTPMLSHLSQQGYQLIRVKNASKGLASVIAEASKQLSSLGIEWMGICLADMPYIHPNTFKELSLHASSSTIVRPQYLNKTGHPVLFGRNFFCRIEHLEGDDGAKSIIQAHKAALKLVDVSDPMVIYDIDKPSDVIQNR